MAARIVRKLSPRSWRLLLISQAYRGYLARDNALEDLRLNSPYGGRFRRIQPIVEKAKEVQYLDSNEVCTMLLKIVALTSNSREEEYHLGSEVEVRKNKPSSHAHFLCQEISTILISLVDYS